MSAGVVVRGAAVRHGGEQRRQRRRRASSSATTPSLNAGVNLRLGFTNLSLDGTSTPTSARSSRDAGQVTVNERFALFFPEKRPFFLEGIELFSTPNQLVYTRRIVDPIGGRQGHRQVRPHERRLPRRRRTKESAGDALFNVPRPRATSARTRIAGLTFTDRSDGGDVQPRGGGRRADRLRQALLRQGPVRPVVDRASTTAGRTRRSGWREFDRTGRAWGFNYKLKGIGERLQGAGRASCRATTS